MRVVNYSEVYEQSTNPFSLNPIFQVTLQHSVPSKTTEVFRLPTPDNPASVYFRVYTYSRTHSHASWQSALAGGRRHPLTRSLVITCFEASCKSINNCGSGPRKKMVRRAARPLNRTKRTRENRAMRVSIPQTNRT